MNKISFTTLPACLLLLSLMLASACNTFIANFDDNTVLNLTQLKEEMEFEFSRFSQSGAQGANDADTLQYFLAQSMQSLEYEQSKDLNSDTSAQFQIIHDNIQQIVDRFQANDQTLSPGYCKAKWTILANAFDIAISTEESKTKQEGNS